MSHVILSLPQFYAAYKKWITENPIKASDYELTIKWVSYFVAGRINNSHIVSELVYCLSNLLVLFNDRIISKERGLECPTSGDTLKVWLTVLEYCEVLLELSAKEVWGTGGKWLIIMSIQIFKCISRVLLVFRHNEKVIQSPTIQGLIRKEVLQQAQNDSGVSDVSQSNLDLVSFKLKRSGRVVRRVDAAPPIEMRSWHAIKRPNFDNEQTIEDALSSQQLTAEAIYILKPVIHLGALGCFGTQSWKPYMLSLLLDLSSLKLYNKSASCLTTKQRFEISRRYIGLLLYLLRSPFYDYHSRKKISAILTSLSKNLPLVGTILVPLNNYVPFWQSNYFYMWSR